MCFLFVDLFCFPIALSWYFSVINPPSIARNFVFFFGKTNLEYSLQVSFLFHPSVVGGILG